MGDFFRMDASPVLSVSPTGHPCAPTGFSGRLTETPERLTEIPVSRLGMSACAAVVCRERSGCGKCFSASSGLCFMLFGQKNIHSGRPIRKKSLYLP